MSEVVSAWSVDWLPARMIRLVDGAMTALLPVNFVSEIAVFPQIWLKNDTSMRRAHQSARRSRDTRRRL